MESTDCLVRSNACFLVAAPNTPWKAAVQGRSADLASRATLASPLRQHEVQVSGVCPSARVELLRHGNAMYHLMIIETIGGCIMCSIGDATKMQCSKTRRGSIRCEPRTSIVIDSSLRLACMGPVALLDAEDSSELHLLLQFKHTIDSRSVRRGVPYWVV